MFSHPCLLVHLVLDVAEGPADFGHAFSLSVSPKRPGFLLGYADLHTHSIYIFIYIYIYIYIFFFFLKCSNSLHLLAKFNKQFYNIL